MDGLRRIADLIKAQFTRAVNWLRPVRAETFLRIDPLLETEGIPEDVTTTNIKGPRVSLAQEKPRWHTRSFESNLTETNGVRLARLPPAKGLLNLVHILCKDNSQSNSI